MKDNRLTEPALIENIAQTCAAGFGYLGSQTEGQPRIGYIGAISDLRFTTCRHWEVLYLLMLQYYIRWVPFFW